MSTIWGILGIEDRDSTVDEVGQSTVYSAITEIVNRHNEEMRAATAALVAETTTDYSRTFYLPGGGMMQESTRLSRPGAVKPTGEYSVAFDLRDARDQVAWDDISMAYMTLNKLQATLQNITMRHANWVRFQILRHLMNKTNATFVDEVYGSLTIRRLANTDSTTYPPVIGSETGADDNHYIVSGYTAANISDTNNPFPTLVAEIDEHFGEGNIVSFINPAERAKVEALTNFVPASDQFVRDGSATPVLTSDGPAGLPGTLIGRVDGVWVKEWRWFPANYILAIDTMTQAPLIKRIDAPTGIAGRGNLALVATQDEFPLMESYWRAREGYGVGNRLSAVVMELTTDGTYDTPAAYA